jgi:hypothetical protein
MPYNVRYYVPYYAYNVISIPQGEPPELVESGTNVHAHIFACFRNFGHVRLYVGENLCTEDLIRWLHIFYHAVLMYGTVRYQARQFFC